jgi:beta-RFAP synthase
LHLGFLDLNGSLGRRFGSVGLSLADLPLELSAAPARGIKVTGPVAARAEEIARSMLAELGYSGGVDLRITRAIPEHAGLGSGTQLALAVGTACARLAGAELGTEKIAAMLLRGQRSGIGIGTFGFGGLIVDGGRGPESRVPPVISRLCVPEEWRFVLVLDRARQGTHGDRESMAFSHLPEMPEAQSAQLCRLVLMRLLPAVAEADCDAFGAAVACIQAVMGEMFAQFQCGTFTSPDVAAAAAFLEQHGATGIGQSSWGPTGFAVFRCAADAARAVELACRRWHDNAQVDFVSCRAANRPAAIRTDAAIRHARA